jgi:hypothetical protein
VLQVCACGEGGGPCMWKRCLLSAVHLGDGAAARVGVGVCACGDARDRACVEGLELEGGVRAVRGGGCVHAQGGLGQREGG